MPVSCFKTLHLDTLGCCCYRLTRKLTIASDYSGVSSEQTNCGTLPFDSTLLHFSSIQFFVVAIRTSECYGSIICSMMVLTSCTRLWGTRNAHSLLKHLPHAFLVGNQQEHSSRTCEISVTTPPPFPPLTSDVIRHYLEGNEGHRFDK